MGKMKVLESIRSPTDWKSEREGDVVESLKIGFVYGRNDEKKTIEKNVH